MAFDAFLKFKGINGDSARKGYEKWIEVDSFSFGVSNSSQQSGTDGAGAGKATFQDFTFVARLSSATIPLVLGAASGADQGEAQLDLVKSGGKTGAAYYTIKLTNATVTRFEEGGTAGGDADPTDVCSLAFQKIDWSYVSPSGAASRGGWDLALGKKA